METKEIFAKRVIALRKEKGISQSQLADLVGISKTSANLYESASRVPDIQVLVRYALELEVSTDYLLGLSDNKTVETQAIGKDIWLGDEAINYLRYYKKIDRSAHDVTYNDIPEEASLEVVEQILAQGVLGKSVDELPRNMAGIHLILNNLIKDPKFLYLLQSYIFSYHVLEDDKITEEDRTMIALIRLQTYLMEIHRRWKELDEYLEQEYMKEENNAEED